MLLERLCVGQCVCSPRSSARTCADADADADAVPDRPVRSVVIEQEAVCAVGGQTGRLCPEMLRADTGPPHYLLVVMVLSARTKCCAELTPGQLDTFMMMLATWPVRW